MPTSIEPLRPSSKLSQAALAVIMRSASSRETACSGPITWPPSVRGVTAAYIVRNGLYGFSDVSGSTPNMWSVLRTTFTPARSHSARPMNVLAAVSPSAGSSASPSL